MITRAGIGPGVWVWMAFIGVFAVRTISLGLLLQGTQRYTRRQFNMAHPEAAQPVLIAQVVALVLYFVIWLPLLILRESIGTTNLLLASAILLGALAVVEIWLAVRHRVYVGGFGKACYARIELEPWKRKLYVAFQPTFAVGLIGLFWLMLRVLPT